MAWRLFLSHVWGTGQDQVRVIKQRLLQLVPGLAGGIFLDGSATAFVSLAGSAKCADDGGTCACEGYASYGKRYVSGQPGSGAEVTTFEEQLQAGNIATTWVGGSATCQVSTFGVNIVSGYSGACFCLSVSPPPLENSSRMRSKVTSLRTTALAATS